MSTSLDLALDDVILRNRKDARRGGLGRGGRGRGRCSTGGGFVPSTRGLGPDRRFRGGFFRCSPYAVPPPARKMAMPVFEPMIVPECGEGQGTMLYLSNLDYGVTNQDIKLLFSDVGELKRYSINYDKSGRSKGTAEVVYARRADALTAIKRYNNLQLDGKPLQIELIGVNVMAVPPPVCLPPPTLHPFKRYSIEESFRATQRPGCSGIGRGRGARQERGRGARQERGRGQRLSAEELDAELDRYRIEAMQQK